MTLIRLASLTCVCAAMAVAGCQSTPPVPHDPPAEAEQLEQTDLQRSAAAQDATAKKAPQDALPQTAEAPAIGTDQASSTSSVPPTDTAPMTPARRNDYPPRFSAKASLYDVRGPGYPLLQSAQSALRTFPADQLGNIDWVEAMRRGLIDPRVSVNGSGEMKRRDDDIIMRETREMPWVRFPHRQHTEWLDCSNCHPRPFKESTGNNGITMDTIMRGQHCGMCHDRVAFSIFTCERCHSIPHAGSPAVWW